METGQTLDDESRPGVSAKKNRRDRLIHLGATCPTLALGFQDEVWWSHLAQPSMSTRTDDKHLRLVEKTRLQADTDAKPLACYGLVLPQTDAMLWRFVHGRSVSQGTCDDLAWVAQRIA